MMTKLAPQMQEMHMRKSLLELHRRKPKRPAREGEVVSREKISNSSLLTAGFSKGESDGKKICHNSEVGHTAAGTDRVLLQDIHC